MMAAESISGSSGPCLVVASGVERARSLQALIERATGQPVIVFHDCVSAIDAIEDHPGYFSRIVVDQHVGGDLSLDAFQIRVSEEEPGLVVQLVGALAPGLRMFPSDHTAATNFCALAQYVPLDAALIMRPLPTVSMC